ncbi:hypothetical protein [Streptomyces sp. ISL-100]|uniref:hypothetical protein n=1 Tax=Streptomyces sp. ISL-100 TaxID=2819173 RepID=UPI001BE58E83|nr:hypothetical protein [Streptomyces sp. ISL-100]MBT2399773.1 hypothetical protein [Streptomyces sp. ISL-100]
MRDLTVRFLAWVLGACTPHPHGRHRLGATPATLRITPAPPRFTDLLDGSTSLLVRPYVLDPAERRRQRERRRTLHLATLGIDVGPDWIHGVRVSAR